MKKELKHRKKRYIAAAVLILLLITCGIYISDYYTADDSCNQILAEAMVEDGMYAFGDTEAENGIVFYPGGKVEYSAYANLAKDLADQGIFCVVVKVPCKLAFFDINAADDAMSRYPDIKNWYVGGHSLGGVAASTYASSNTDVIKGVILLASYSTKDISMLDNISLYGSNDGVLAFDKYESHKSMLGGYEEYQIEGGNHCGFGSYGFQKGDNTATISSDEQQEIAAGFIAECILE